MKPILMIGLLIAAAGTAGCGPKISKETYVTVMSEMGCRLVQENTPAAEALLKEKGVGPADIAEFRKKADRQEMMEAATEIAAKVAACHGAQATTP
jgi:hypothetical protein